MLPSLDKRLSTAAEMVRQGAVVADIGTDHAYLPCYLTGSGISPYAYACDINSAPLARARKTVERFGLTEKISLCLSNGLEALPEHCAQDIIICGMGGELIADIIHNAAWLKAADVHLILQPMTRPEHLRRFLFTNGFDIIREQGIHIGRHYYTVMLASYTGICLEPDLLLQSIGRLKGNTDEDSAAYIKHYLEVLGRTIQGLEQGKAEENGPELQRLRLLAEQIQALYTI
ncbi:class I SAM-dependent methyltransferase [Acetanaerobacterium elongatum]|uniref:tRNA (Adenine22-N1)-methyltransferase n=1 Tax=Acetanaerobacterium elongatum TaxID=258515 RepID=A0A1G9VSX2_9FIRM|nr:class I SAM-dependent methyltransferase [Acetanaerobacterium elongatum]SDM75157.1 tRNA (adenine22-N1)-methyltransferase [Acetanaerobacterium elongatum]